MHYKLTFQGLIIPFLEWFRSGHNCSLTWFSVLENFASYIKNKSVDYNVILKELYTIQNYKTQRRPKHSTVMIKFPLLVWYTSYQTYRLSLEHLPLSSLSLLKSLHLKMLMLLKLQNCRWKNLYFRRRCPHYWWNVLANISALSLRTLSVFHKIFVICNSNTQFNTSNGLGNAVIPNVKTIFFMCSKLD